MPPIVTTAEIDRSAAQVFACATDPALFAQWQKGVGDAQAQVLGSAGPQRPGQRIPQSSLAGVKRQVSAHDGRCQAGSHRRTAVSAANWRRHKLVHMPAQPGQAEARTSETAAIPARSQGPGMEVGIIPAVTVGLLIAGPGWPGPAISRAS
jgi:hypothetical protein